MSTRKSKDVGVISATRYWRFSLQLCMRTNSKLRAIAIQSEESLHTSGWNRQ